jgi:hypothetical protein
MISLVCNNVDGAVEQRRLQISKGGERKEDDWPAQALADLSPDGAVHPSQSSVGLSKIKRRELGEGERQRKNDEGCWGPGYNLRAECQSFARGKRGWRKLHGRTEDGSLTASEPCLIEKWVVVLCVEAGEHTCVRRMRVGPPLHRQLSELSHHPP